MMVDKRGHEPSRNQHPLLQDLYPPWQRKCRRSSIPSILVQQAQLQRIFATQLLNQKNPDQGKDGTNLFALAASAVQPQIPNNFYANQSIKPSTVTSTQVTVITTTETATKVYTLIYNAFSTKFRTVTSTNVFPTTVTSLITKTITNTATFPSFFGWEQMNLFEEELKTEDEDY